MVPKEEFSKYVLKGDKGKFRLGFKGGVKIQRLTIDIMLYSGDVNFIISNLEDTSYDITYYKYYLSNKVHYFFNCFQVTIDSLEIEYIGIINSFFTIKYEINSYNLIQLEENIISGESYLVQIDPTTNEKYKTIYLSNNRINMEKPFLANFYSLNCDLQITRGEKEITFFNGYAQEIITKDDSGYNSEEYEYKIKIKEQDLSNYIHKFCMLYVSGYESKDSEYQTEIVVGENVNQKIIFNKDFQTIRFLYPHADPDKDLVFMLISLIKLIIILKFM